jgi:hypothetical protein
MKSGVLNEVDVATLEYDASLVRPDPPPAAGALAGRRLKADDAEMTRETTPETTREIWVDHGYLVDGAKRTLIGTKASDLQKLIDALPLATPLVNVTALVNSSQLRRLRLSGDYTGDVTLHLPSLFVLALDEGTTYSGGNSTVRDPWSVRKTGCKMPACCVETGERVPANFTGKCACENCDGNSMIQVTGTYYTTILGGHFDCSDLPQTYHGSAAISATGTTAFTASHATLSNCGQGKNCKAPRYCCELEHIPGFRPESSAVIGRL